MRDEGAQVAVGETVGQQPEGAQGGEQGLDAGLVRGRPAVRVPAGLMTGWVRAARAAAPSAGSWLIRWTPSRRLLAVKPISFSSGR